MPTLEEQFWEKVRKAPGDGCWEWIGPRARGGYGRFSTPSGMVGAHRFSWTLTHGSIPSTLLICHHCDNPPCVRPGHLFPGTAQDNVLDASRKGRLVGNRTSGRQRRIAWLKRQLQELEREEAADAVNRRSAP
jgi:hypothetical protein